MRIAIFFILMFSLQSILPVLLPSNFMSPDLFLLVALTLAARSNPTYGLLSGYGIGMLRDIFGAGLLGWHAASIATGVLLGNQVRTWLSSENNLNHAVAVAVAEVGKWLMFVVLNYWTRRELFNDQTLTRVFLPELAATLIVGPLVYALARWAFGPVYAGGERLL
jgi:rod shape-determining protein MreD